MRNTTLHISNKVTKIINMMKKLSLLFLFITFLCGTSAYAAPVEGKTFTNVDHLGAYPTPQNMTVRSAATKSCFSGTAYIGLRTATLRRLTGGRCRPVSIMLLIVALGRAAPPSGASGGIAVS